MSGVIYIVVGSSLDSAQGHLSTACAHQTCPFSESCSLYNYNVGTVSLKVAVPIRLCRLFDRCSPSWCQPCWYLLSSCRQSCLPCCCLLYCLVSLQHLWAQNSAKLGAYKASRAGSMMALMARARISPSFFFSFFLLAGAMVWEQIHVVNHARSSFLDGVVKNSTISLSACKVRQSRSKDGDRVWCKGHLVSSPTGVITRSIILNTTQPESTAEEKEETKDGWNI